MILIIYVCPKCGRPHSLEEFNESYFCRHCETFLTYGNRRVLEEDKRNAIARTSIEKTYESIRKYVPRGNLIDSLEVVKQVEEYRQFWKPEKTNVVLLAESHVYTDEKDIRIKCESSILDEILLPENPDYPVNFVRFVYCLGYGENDVLTKRIDKNDMGTWQFWKIFSSCVAENESDLGFHRVLKTKTRSFISRLHNKIDVLRKMKEKGVWLLDASIVGLAGSGIKDYPDTYERIIGICWDNHLKKVIENAQPKHIIVIGIDVEKTLHFELRKLKIDLTTIDAPQRHLKRQRQQENYKKYQRICARYC